MLMHLVNKKKTHNCTHMCSWYICIMHEKTPLHSQRQKHFLLNAKWVPRVLPLSILTATVLHVESLSIPKAEASTTLPKAPCPSVLPARRKQYLVNGTAAAEPPVPPVQSLSVSYVSAAGVKQDAQAQIVVISQLHGLSKCVKMIKNIQFKFE